MTGTIIISLDFELHWGGFDKIWLGDGFRVRGPEFRVQSSGFKAVNSDSDPDLRSDGRVRNYAAYFANTRRVIPEMLATFEKHRVHVTWAGVGMLFHQEREDLVQNLPEQRPSYVNPRLSAYQYMEEHGVGVDESEDPFHYAGSLVGRIVNTEFQELGSHTFGHYYCNEPGQTPEQFRSDLRSAQKAAKAYGVRLRSLVFPRNQFSDEYLKVCYEEGFHCVRSNPRDWWWQIDSTQNESRWKRLNRGIDAYLPIGRKSAYSLSSITKREGYPLCLPASRLLRPYRPGELFLNRMKINRVRHEMESAARAGEVYHLWWHPHNFGWYPKESMEGLEAILRHFDYCRSKFGMESLSMGEAGERVNGHVSANGGLASAEM